MARTDRELDTRLTCCKAKKADARWAKMAGASRDAGELDTVAR